METLANLESFIRSADNGSFSAAARLLNLSPAAVSRNVAQLERNLGVKLFQRTTRGLALTEAGEALFLSIREELTSIQSTLAGITQSQGQPAGILKINAAPGFAVEYLLPLMPEFIQRYPCITPDWNFNSSPENLISSGCDIALGGGFTPSPGVVARRLGTIRLIAVASAEFMKGKPMPASPAELAAYPGVVLRSPVDNRIRSLLLRQEEGPEEVAAILRPAMIVNDPQVLHHAVLLGTGVGLVAVHHAQRDLQNGRLINILPGWHHQVGDLFLYFHKSRLMPAKTRVFIDFIVDTFQNHPAYQAVFS